MDFSHFDARKYPTVGVEEGYSEWAATYEDIVMDAMDLRLLARIQSVAWEGVQVAVDLACGTGRIGAWLTQRGVRAIDGVDLTAAMLEGARAKGVYRQLFQGDLRATTLPGASYELVSVVLADEHLPAVAPLYAEAARIATPGAKLVLVGYHPFFLLSGIPTHFNQASGEPATIECYVHLFSDHIAAALEAGWTLREMHEGLIDGDWLAVKPKWAKYANRPVSFALVWEKQS